MLSMTDLLQRMVLNNMQSVVDLNEVNLEWWSKLYFCPMKVANIFAEKKNNISGSQTFRVIRCCKAMCVA